MEIWFDRRSAWDFNRDCVAFPAMVEGKVVRCLISQEALQDHFGGGILGADLVGTFEANRGAIEAVARMKLQTSRGNPLLLKSEDF